MSPITPETLLVFLFGITVGSFLGVLIDRIPYGESVVEGRSRCDHCKKPLAWFDLIPLLSFFLLKGKCRYCKTKLSWFYPSIELVTGVVFVLTFLSVPGLSLFHFLIVSSLIVIFFTDLKHGIIPDLIVFPAIVVSFLYIIHNTSYSILPYVISAFGALLLFLFLTMVTRGRGMGLGDVKFAFLMGLLLGFPSITFAIYLAFLTGGMLSLILLVWGKKKFGQTIPFGPFLAASTLVFFLFGHQAQRLISTALPSLSFLL